MIRWLVLAIALIALLKAPRAEPLPLNVSHEPMRVLYAATSVAAGAAWQAKHKDSGHEQSHRGYRTLP
jgi:hypothetical protein